MKRIALYLGFATALVASCSIQEEDFKTPQQDDVVFYASFEQPTEEGTRVYANEDLLLRWTADDRVSIFNRLTYNQEFKFLGETGDNAGGFNRVDNAEFVTGNSIPHVVSVSPYQASTKITEDETLTVTLPAEQHYAKNTFGPDANAMVSVSSDNVLQYKNVGGYLMLKLYGEGISVSSITLKGNNGEKLAGKAVVTMPLDGVPTAVMADDATSEITLVCDTPVTLGSTADESAQFWFVVPPASFSRGFQITVSSNGGAFESATEKTITIERNKLSKMSPMEVVPVVKRKYLTFTSERTTSLSLTNNNDNAPVLYYSTDKENWTLWDYSGLTFTKDQPLYLYGDNPNGFSSFDVTTTHYSSFSASGSSFGVSGDIMCLLDSEHDLITIPSDYCFFQLFRDCSNLISAPDLPATTLTSHCYSQLFSGCSSLKTAPELPATTLMDDCYSYMFDSCLGLTTAPRLPATILADGCYGGMFNACTSLTAAPELPAMTLAGQCYARMFEGCTSLRTAPELPATKLAERCYYGMFIFCKSLTTAPKLLPATTLADHCYDSMFSACSSLTTAPELPATTLASYCYSEMFNGCLSLTTAPELPANRLAKQCYYMMFFGCSKLNYVKSLATDISASFCVRSWLDGVASSGVFIKASGMNVWPSGASGIPEGWTVVDDNLVPEAVDLGLPSGLKWASFNLGASSPEEYGDYYAWGEVKPYYEAGEAQYDPPRWKQGKEAGYDWPSYRWCMGITTDDAGTLTKYCYKYGYEGYTDGLTVLELEDDAAYANLGSSWRIPTDAEWKELIDNCSWTWTKMKGVQNGYLVISKINGNSIFLPAAGFRQSCDWRLYTSVGSYWTSSLKENDNPHFAWHYSLDKYEVVRGVNFGRATGRSIRPVCMR